MGSPPSADVWLDERITLGASSIDGNGLFFAASVPVASVVIRLGGSLVSTERLQALIETARHDPEALFIDTITIDEGEHLVLPPRTPVHFGNHSCDPTLWHVSPYELATTRPVEPGEEATVDYGTQSGAPGFHMACSCGSMNCRGVVSSEDWRDERMRVRYQGHWVPALQARIDAGQTNGS